jgi:hypothetical protein
MKVRTEPQTIAMDKAGKVFYATSLNPTSALSVACEREELSLATTRRGLEDGWSYAAVVDPRFR